MKSFKSLGLSVAILSTLLISCSKNQQSPIGDNELDLPTTSSHVNVGANLNSMASNMIASEQNIIPTNISFCSTKSVSLCTKKESVGTLTIKRGSNGKVYLIYKATGSYYFTQLNLFTGVTSAIPMSGQEPNICSFPYKKSFNSPYPQQYTIVLNNQPASFTVAAYASIVKKQGNSYKNEEDVWADGCSGTKIYTGNSSSNYGNNDDNDHQGCNDNNHNSREACGGDDHEDEGCGGSYVSSECKGGTWATRFTYTGATCGVTPAPPVVISTPVEPDICAYPICNYFATHATYGAIVAWAEQNVTVAGIAYTEAEGRAIAGTTDANGVVADSKYAFLRVATLKLSYTNYAASPSLAPAVNTIETWLASTGKLSPSNLPTGNAAVKTAATLINTFIEAHKCPERME